MATSYSLQRIVVGADGLNKVEAQTGIFPLWISDTAPDTTGASVGDCWLDTSTLTDSDPAVFRFLQANGQFWPLPDGETPDTTLLLFDDFTGADGAVWNAAKWGLGRAPTTGTGGSATLLSGSGVLQTSNSGAYASGSTIARRALITPTADVNITGRLKFDTSECFLSLYARHNTDVVDGDNAYGFNASASLGKWSIAKQAGYVTTVLGVEQSYTFTPGTWYRFRMYAVGTAIKGKVWVDGVAEPGTFPVSVTDSTYTAAGKVGVRLGTGAAALSSRVFLDDFTIRSS